MFRRFAPVLVLTSLLALAACERKQAAAPAAPPAPAVTAAKPLIKEIIEYDEFTGRFDAVGSVDIRARVAGYLSAAHFKDGALVEQGDLLFTIDKRSYEASLAQADAAVREAQTRVEFAQTEFARAESTVRQGVSPVRTLDERRQQLTGAQADLAGARAALIQAQLNLEYTEVRSPIAGRIGRKLVTEGNLVNANTTMLANVVSIDPIYFYFDVDERSYLAYMRMARAGERPSARETAYPVTVVLGDSRQDPRKGHLDFVDNRIDEATGTIRGRALIENADGTLAPGLFGRIRVPGSPSYKAVLIPDEAISADQDKRVVMVVGADGSVTPRAVRPGSREDGYRIVREGLSADDVIVIAGLPRARPGQKVTAKIVDLPPKR